MNKKPLIIVGALLLLVFVATSTADDSPSNSGGDSTQNSDNENMTSGDRSFLQGQEERIAGTSDCEELQVIFDASAGAHDTFSDEEPPNLSKMLMHTGIMDASDERMQEVGCY